MIGKGPLSSTVLPGWEVCPLWGHQGEEETASSPLRLGPLVRAESARGVAGQSDFVVLRTLAQATVFLGALVDQAEVVHEWLEIWVEDEANKLEEGGGHADLWADQVAAMAAISGHDLMASDWPSSTAALEALGFNTHGGRVQVRKYAAFDLIRYSELISRAAVREPVLETELLASVCQVALGAEEHIRFGEGFYLLSRRGSAGLFGESLFLKLNLLHQILTLCEGSTVALGRPLLNLASAGFGVDFKSGSGMLPAAWTAKVVLRDPGAPVSRFLELEEATYFALDAPATDSIYQSRAVKPPVEGSGTVRIRKAEERGEDLVVEGTLASAEALPEDGLLELDLELPSGRTEIRARLTPGGAVDGERRFVALARMSPEERLHLAEPKRLAPFPNAAFRLRPPLSSACDLYSMAVMGMELLLVDGQQTLSVVLDEMISLGDFLRTVPVSDEVPLIIETAVREQESGSWGRTLGPQRLIQDVDGRPFAYEEALGFIPSEIWWRTIYLLLRMLTNGWHFNFCKHLNDAPSLALHTVYRQPRSQLEMTLDQLRSLILLDWDLNQEVRSLVEGRLAAL